MRDILQKRLAFIFIYVFVHICVHIFWHNVIILNANMQENNNKYLHHDIFFKTVERNFLKIGKYLGNFGFEMYFIHDCC